MTEPMRDESKKEIDRLQYKGNQVPLFIKFVWLAIAVYSVAYFMLYAWPDLQKWLKR